MLKALKTISLRHEDVFVQRYQRLLTWCLRITGNDREQAEDLIQDGFIQFTLSSPDLDSIQNVDSYLFVLLRNLHLSRVRRAAQPRNGLLSLTDFDSAAVVLRVSDPSARLHSQAELLKICEYALLRKNTSRAGSVLILRYFLGYYPTEVARIIGCQRRAVDDYLRTARGETKNHLGDSSHGKLEEDLASVQISRALIGKGTDEFLNALRVVILRSATGDCIPSQKLRRLYRDAGQLDCTTLAHLVSCGQCLDGTNELLGLPSLAERLPTDTMGRDWPPRDGTSGTPFGGASSDRAKVYRDRAKETFEHKPHELRVYVNGFIQGSQKISSAHSEQELTVNSPEKMAFVEIFSEQGIQLLFAAVNPPPEGDVDQVTHAELSDGRTLQLSVNFSGPWPVIQTIYCDPDLATGLSPDVIPAKRVEADQAGRNTERLLAIAGVSAFRLPVKDLLLRLMGLRPNRIRRAIVAATACVVALALVFYELRPVPVSAAILLQKSAAADRAIYGKKSLVVHRVVNMEAAKLPDRREVLRRKIEVWGNGASGITVRRLFDENGKLLAGEWIRPNESAKTYYAGGGSGARANGPLDIQTRNIWWLEFSATEFSSLIQDGKAVTVRQEGGTYVLNATASHLLVVKGVSLDLVNASITLNRADFHPVDETLVLRETGATWEFRFTEKGFGTEAANALNPNVFKIDREFSEPVPASEINPAASTRSLFEAQRRKKQSQLALEVEVLHRLDQVGATTRGQVTLEREPNGSLLIQGVVENGERKEEIRRALGLLVQNPLLKSNVQTVAEGVASQGNLAGEPVYQSDLEVAKASIPVYSELARYFSAQLLRNPSLVGKESKDTWIDSQIRRFADRVVEQSIQATLHAGVLKDLANRFSADDLKEMKPEVRAKWQEMLRDHAQSFEQQCRLIRLELRPIFFPDSPLDEAKQDSSAITGRNSDHQKQDLLQSAGQLSNLATTHERAIRLAFTVSGQSPSVETAAMQKLWSSLLLAEKLASSVAEDR